MRKLMTVMMPSSEKTTTRNRRNSVYELKLTIRQRSNALINLWWIQSSSFSSARILSLVQFWETSYLPEQIVFNGNLESFVFGQSLEQEYVSLLSLDPVCVWSGRLVLLHVAPRSDDSVYQIFKSAKVFKRKNREQRVINDWSTLFCRACVSLVV